MNVLVGADSELLWPLIEEAIIAPPNEQLLGWLRDDRAERMLTAQSKRLAYYPELRERISKHITETEGGRDEQ